MTDKQLAPKKTTIRWIDDEDIESDLDELAARFRLNRSELIRIMARIALYPELFDRLSFMAEETSLALTMYMET